MTQHHGRDEPGSNAFVDAAWRQASVDEPTAAVDAAILAAARAEVSHQAPAQRPKVREPWWSRWQPLAAAAGVAGLAFILAQLLPRDEVLHVPPASDGAPMREDSVTLSPSDDAAVQQARRATNEPDTPAAATPPSAPAAAPVAAEFPAVTPTPAPVAPAATVPIPAVTAELAGAARESTAGPPDRTAWVDRIIGLHSNGDLAAAATELRAFRQAYPEADQYLPEALRSWAASVPAEDMP